MSMNVARTLLHFELLIKKNWFRPANEESYVSSARFECFSNPLSTVTVVDLCVCCKACD